MLSERRTASRRGFTLTELVLALALSSVAVAVLFGLLGSQQRVAASQSATARLNDELRLMRALLEAELSELVTGDPLSDLLSVGDSEITYRAWQNLYVTCRPALDRATAGSITLEGAARSARRAVDPARDSLVVLAGTGRGEAPRWIHANVRSAVREAGACPGGRAGIVVELDRVRPALGLAAVGAGAPVRSYEVGRLRAYRSGRQWWLGYQHVVKDRGWVTVQPVLGPLAAGGLRVTLADAAGGAATPRGARTIRVAAQVAASPAWRWGATRPEDDRAETVVTLRHVPRSEGGGED